MTDLQPLYTAEEMKAAEAGHDVEAMMERAGGAVAAAVSRDYPGTRVVAVCGKGANGGDGRIAAQKLGAEVVELGAELPPGDVVIDAVFGTGFHGEPRTEAARSIEAIRSAGVPVVAVDVPSGVNASTGEISGLCVEAATTVTFHGEKVGLAVAPGSLHAGRIEIADIGLEQAETRHARVTSEIVSRLPKRERDGANVNALVPFFCVRMLVTDRERFNILIKGLLWTALPLVLLGLYQAQTGDSPYRFLMERGLLWETIKAGIMPSRRQSAPARSRLGRDSGAATRQGSSSDGCWRKPTCRQSSTPTRCSASSGSSETLRRC